jgi:hypothetical protein
MQTQSIINWHDKSIITYLNSSVSVLNSCSICQNTCTISLIMIGHSEVTCCGVIRNRSTRKQRKTCAWTDGTTWGNRRLSASRSKKEESYLNSFVPTYTCPSSNDKVSILIIIHDTYGFMNYKFNTSKFTKNKGKKLEWAF